MHETEKTKSNHKYSKDVENVNSYQNVVITCQKKAKNWSVFIIKYAENTPFCGPVTEQ